MSQELDAVPCSNGETETPWTITGPCCACREVRPLVSIVQLPFKAPSAASGIGWGCVVCGLPPQGAIAVLCAECDAAPGINIGLVCATTSSDPARVALELVGGRHSHDLARHIEAVEREGRLFATASEVQHV